MAQGILTGIGLSGAGLYVLAGGMALLALVALEGMDWSVRWWTTPTLIWKGRPKRMSDGSRQPLRVGWFATGQGTTSRSLLQAAAELIRTGRLRAEIPFLFCNREPGEHENSDLLLKMARDYAVPTVTLSDRRFRRRSGGEVARAGEPLPPWRLEYDRAVLDLLAPFETDLGMLAGYMLIFGPEVCARYNLLNLHPAAPGGPIGTWQRVIWQLIERRASENGVLINRVIPAVDEGPVVTWCRYSLRGPHFDPLWQAIEARSIDEIREAEGEALPLFRAIRAAGVARELPLVLESLAALAERRVWFENGHPYAASGPLEGGLDLTERIEASLIRSEQPTHK